MKETQHRRPCCIRRGVAAGAPLAAGALLHRARDCACLWLGYLYQGTGHIFGNAEFTHYNVGFQLHPVRLGVTLLRRVYYVFIANLHIVGTVAIVLAWKRTRIFRNRDWAIVAAVARRPDACCHGPRRRRAGTLSDAGPAAFLYRRRGRARDIR